MLAVYSILSCFSKLCFPHNNWMLTDMLDEPPLDQGIMWSKCRSSVAPHFVHFPPSLCQTSNFTQVGITLLVFECSGTGKEKSSSPSTAVSLNLKTLLPLLFSRQESIRWKTPLLGPYSLLYLFVDSDSFRRFQPSLMFLGCTMELSIFSEVA